MIVKHGRNEKLGATRLCIVIKGTRKIQIPITNITDYLFQCVVIGLQSTGEARTLEQLDEMGGELNDFVSTAK